MHPESDFTAPHQFAPHPEWWHSHDSEATEEEVGILIQGLIRALQPEFVVETGAHVGRTTVKIAEALHANGHGYGIALEVDAGRAAEARRAVQAPLLGSWVGVYEMSSLDFTPEQPIDFLFCDSLYELRPLEIKRFRPWLIPGRSVIAVHDWTSGIRGHYRDVRADLMELGAEGVITQPLFLPTPRGLALTTIP